MKRKQKNFVLISSMLLVPAFTFLLFFYSYKLKTEKQNILNNESYIVDIQKNSVDKALKIIINDLKILAEHTQTIDLWEIKNSDYNYKLNKLSYEFSAFSKGRVNVYDQLRYIDTNGTEIIRINVASGEQTAVTKNNLQNKKDRYYFKDIVALDSGQIYISPLDLNVEHKSIEQPIKPMIRFGIPIIHDGIRRGIIVINYLGKNTLDAFNAHTTRSIGQNYFLNSSGYFLIANDTAKEWSFMYPNKKDIKFQQEFKDEWEQVAANNEDQFITKKGCFTYRTVKPLSNNISSISVDKQVKGESETIVYANDYYWKLISFIPKETFNHYLWPIRREFLLFSSLLTAFILLSAWQLSVMRERKRIAEEAVRLTNINLETIVQERTQDFLEAKEQAEESNRLKTAFLANISHEIRTPMNGLLGFLNLLKSTDLSKEKSALYIKQIEQSGERIISTFDDLIKISRIESNQVETIITETNVYELVNNLYNNFKPEAELKQIQLVLNNNLTIRDARLFTDKTKLESILNNLIRNALKFTHQGTIEIGCAPITTNNTKSVEFYVKDTGIGIDKKHHEVIFEHFRQADIEDKDVYEGSGLGLAISKSFIETLGGTIWLESELGKGAAFFFNIPSINDSDDDGSSSNIPSPKERFNKYLKVLIAEDDEISRLYLEQLLSNYTQEILTAKNGLEAIQILQLHKDVDIVLMDLKMPKLNGLQAIEQIRAFNKQVVIILQTAFTNISFKPKKEKYNAILHKPYTEEKLLSVIEKYIN